MGKQFTNPSFEETEVPTVDLKDIGFKFNTQVIGPMNFIGLRNANYGYKFRMSTIPELIPLVHVSLENKQYNFAKHVIDTIQAFATHPWLMGNTGIHYTSRGMYVQDNPKIKHEKISMDEKILKNKLGSYEEKGVVFSDDRTIRFTPYGFKIKSQTPSDLSRNSGISALVCGQENAEKLARISSNEVIQDKANPYFRAIEKPVPIPQTRVAVLGSYTLADSIDIFHCGLYVHALYSEESDVGYSFGIKKIRK